MTFRKYARPRVLYTAFQSMQQSFKGCAQLFESPNVSCLNRCKIALFILEMTKNETLVKTCKPAQAKRYKRKDIDAFNNEVHRCIVHHFFVPVRAT